jgi:hypothetical protein
VHRDPRLFELDRSSWALACIRSVIGWMQSLTLSAVSQLLTRFSLIYKRGRQHVHSPDPLYDQKLAQIARACELAQQAPGQVVFLYADEHSAHLRPMVGRTYARSGGKGTKATGAASRLLRLAGRSMSPRDRCWFDDAAPSR